MTFTIQTFTMGRSGLDILQQKSWHVLRRHNIERVRKGIWIKILIIRNFSVVENYIRDL